MKTVIRKTLKTALILLLIFSSTTGLIMHYASDFDPVREIQKLKSQNRRDDALDLVQFYKENKIIDNQKIKELEKEIEYTTPEKMKSFATGVIKGEVYDTYSGIGAISSDLCVFGDIRDMGIQSYKYAMDHPDFDNVVAVLSGVGIVLSLKPFSHVLISFTKNTFKYLRRISKFVKNGILKKFLSEKILMKDSKMIFDLLKKTNGLYQERYLL